MESLPSPLLHYSSGPPAKDPMTPTSLQVHQQHIVSPTTFAQSISFTPFWGDQGIIVLGWLCRWPGEAMLGEWREREKGRLSIRGALSNELPRWGSESQLG